MLAAKLCVYIQTVEFVGGGVWVMSKVFAQPPNILTAYDNNSTTNIPNTFGYGMTDNGVPLANEYIYLNL